MFLNKCKFILLISCWFVGKIVYFYTYYTYYIIKLMFFSAFRMGQNSTLGSQHNWTSSYIITFYAPEGSVNGRNVKDGLMVVALRDSQQHGGQLVLPEHSQQSDISTIVDGEPVQSEISHARDLRWKQKDRRNKCKLNNGNSKLLYYQNLKHIKNDFFF